MNKVTKLALPKKGVINSYFVASDWHDYHASEAAVNILIKTALKIPRSKRRLLILGDFLDLAELMPRNPDYKKWIKRTDGMEEYFLPAIERAFEWGNRTLDRLQKVFNEIIFFEGNHDARLRIFREGNCPPPYKDYFYLTSGLNLVHRKIKVIYYNNWLDIGNVSLCHGAYCGPSAIKKHVEACGRSVIFGHVHKFETKPFIRRGDTVQGWSTPCMSTLAPEYLKNRENDWVLGFGILHVRHTGRFNFNIFTVWDDILIDMYGKKIT
jgi:UDP-2,3-diacylglucosamine pyrophosphatase LpxH